MLEAAWWGFVGGAALLRRAPCWGSTSRCGLRVIGLVMAFGAGVLISAVAFELTEEAYRSAGGIAAALGLAAGLGHVLHRRLADRPAGRPPAQEPGPRWGAPAGAGADTGSRRSAGSATAASGAAASSGTALVLGALLDGIPESAAIGISLIGGGGVGVAMVAAVFLSNIPESMSATTGLKASGRSTGWILGPVGARRGRVDAGVGAGYALLGGASQETVAFIQTFAAGAILTMLADTMVPEAVEHAGPARRAAHRARLRGGVLPQRRLSRTAGRPRSGHLGGGAAGGLHRLAGRVPGPHPAGHVRHLVALLGQPRHDPLHPAAGAAGDDQGLVGVEERGELVDPRRAARTSGCAPPSGRARGPTRPARGCRARRRRRAARSRGRRGSRARHSSPACQRSAATSGTCSCGGRRAACRRSGRWRSTAARSRRTTPRAPRRRTRGRSRRCARAPACRPAWRP